MRIVVAALGLAMSSCAFGGSTVLAPPVAKGQAEAVFAGGCFWCIESDFEKLAGVIDAQSGYTGGVIEGPSYEAVSAKQTKHIEAIRVIYDPAKVTYPELVDFFFKHIDPTQADGQFCDRGPQYTTAVFVASDAERKLAQAGKEAAQKALGKTVVTTIRDADKFWLAEEYHQDYYKKNPAHYQRYRTGCGRDATVRALWGSAAH